MPNSRRRAGHGHDPSARMRSEGRNLHLAAEPGADDADPEHAHGTVGNSSTREKWMTVTVSSAEIFRP